MGCLDRPVKIIGAGFLQSLSVSVAEDEINRQTEHGAAYFDHSSDRGSIPLTSNPLFNENGVFRIVS
jgi:hypothetical protein